MKSEVAMKKGRHVLRMNCCYLASPMGIWEFATSESELQGLLAAAQIRAFFAADPRNAGMQGADMHRRPVRTISCECIQWDWRERGTGLTAQCPGDG
jgi:hypothetical protein